MLDELAFEQRCNSVTPKPRVYDKLRMPVSLGILLALLLVMALVKLLDQGFVALNARKAVLPRFDVSLMPYHDPRFTLRDHHLRAYKKPPRIIFTGDSRTMDSFNPEVIAKALGVEPDQFFNFATGSQGISFAREAFIPHILEMGKAPEYVVYGVTPDWLVNRPAIQYHVRWYKSSLAYRLAHPSADDKLDFALTGLIARMFALYRYRSDFLSYEVLPDLKCWLGGDCYIRWPRYNPIHFKEHAYLDGVQTKYGFGPYDWGNHTGEYYGGRRFTEADHVDRENLTALIREMKQAGITPVFLVMPMHPTFDKVHEPALSRNYRELDAIAREEGCDVLYPEGDYSNSKLFTDGHHHTINGSNYFSNDIAPLLRAYL